MIKIGIIESIYDYIFTKATIIANPIKKSIIKTECEVHKSININALVILINDKYLEEYKFFNDFIVDINHGAVWADQDFKSSTHMYHPYRKKGLYGRKNAMDVGVSYYSQAVNLWKSGKYNKSLFYFGAAVHIIQDMTIPQHANVRLLDNHRQYETFVKRMYIYLQKLEVEKGAYLLDSFESYIKFNARVAIKIHRKFKMISDDETRFYKTAKCTLPLAERTTAGAMVMFYHDIFSIS